MTQISVYNTTLEPQSKLKLSASIFDAKVSPLLFSQYVRVYRSNQRSAHAKVMDRGEVSGTTKKMWAQKGTGRARHGSAKAPIFVGGGSAHGPTGQKNYRLKLSQPLRRRVLAYVLTQLKAQDKLITISGLSKLQAKTKSAQNFVDSLLSKFKVTKAKPRLLMVTAKSHPSLVRSTRNLPSLNYVTLSRVNPYLLSNADLVIVTPSVLSVWNKRQ